MWLLAIGLSALTALVYGAQEYRFQGYHWADEVCGMASGWCDTPQPLIFATGILIAVSVCLRLRKALRDN